MNSDYIYAFTNFVGQNVILKWEVTFRKEEFTFIGRTIFSYSLKQINCFTK